MLEAWLIAGHRAEGASMLREAQWAGYWLQVEQPGSAQQLNEVFRGPLVPPERGAIETQHYIPSH
eukprot:1327746-Amphidinium_carterae.1